MNRTGQERAEHAVTCTLSLPSASAGPAAGSCCARGLLSVLTWLVSPIVLGCLVVLLVFWLIVVQGQRLRFKREKSKLRVEFDSYRREMQVKVRRPRAGTVRRNTLSQPDHAPHSPRSICPECGHLACGASTTGDHMLPVNIPCPPGVLAMLGTGSACAMQ